MGVFFKNKYIYLVTIESIKNDMGQIIKVNKKSDTAIKVNIQPIEEKAFKYTFGEDTISKKQMYIDNFLKIGQRIVIDNKGFEVEKSIEWNTYCLCAIKEVDFKWV